VVQPQNHQHDRNGDRRGPQRNTDRHQARKQATAENPRHPVDVDGVKYLVSTRGESQWVKNLQNDPNVTLATKSGTTKYLAHDTPVENRRPFIDAYTLKAGKIVKGYFSKLPDPAASRLHPHPAIILAFQVIRHTDDRHGHVNTSRLKGVTRPSTSACPIQ
jgi:hypothetical protein